MRTKKIVVPIYEYSITLIYTEYMDKLGTKFNITDIDNCRAIVFKRNNRLYVAFGPEHRMADIAHEVVHLISNIYLYYGIKHDLINDEPTAYLTGYLFNEIFKFLTYKEK